MRIEYIELRKEPRINTEVEITYFVQPLDIQEEAAREGAGVSTGTGLLTNLGGSGAGLLLDQPFRPDQTLWLDGLGEPPGTRAATVRWVARAQERYRIGVEFSDPGTSAPDA